MFAALSVVSELDDKSYAVVWPLQTAMMILSPASLLAETTATGAAAATVGPIKTFLRQLEHTLGLRKKQDRRMCAALCHIDVVECAALVSKRALSALRYILPAVERELDAFVLDDPKAPRPSDSARMRYIMAKARGGPGD